MTRDDWNAKRQVYGGDFWNRDALYRKVFADSDVWMVLEDPVLTTGLWADVRVRTYDWGQETRRYHA